MSEHVKPFQPQDLMEGVKAKIRATFVDLIPDDAWDNMVKTEVDRYFKNHLTTGRQVPSYTPFSKFIQNQLEEFCKEKFKEYLNTDEFKSTWDSEGNLMMSKAVEETLVNNAGNILANILGGAMTSALQNSTYRM